MRISIFLVIAFLLIQITATAFASPLLDYAKGKGSIDLCLRNSEITTITQTTSQQWNNKYNFEGTLTYGLSNKYAFQYRYYEPQSANTNINLGFGTHIFKEKVKADEINILYKLSHNVSAIGGLILGKESVEDITDSLFNHSTSKKKLLQVGLVASTSCAPKTTLWGSLAGNNDLTNFGVGLGYAVSPDLDINLSYRNLDAKTDEGEIKIKGLGFGVSYKF